MSGGALFLAVFLACAVEAVEALTIVLAAGTGRDWRSAIIGVVAGVVVLALIVAVLGPAVTAIPLGGLRLVVGGLLLIFGLQWLRKAILRASGLKARHDEDAIYAVELAAAQAVAFVIDCFSRAIVGWHATQVKNTAMVTTALRMALWHRDHQDRQISEGLIHHSAAGSQYTSIAFTETLAMEESRRRLVASVTPTITRWPSRLSACSKPR